MSTSPTAFLFDWNDPSVSGYYAHLAGRTIEAVGRQSPTEPAVARLGDMLTDTFTRRLTRVQRLPLDSSRPQVVGHSSTTLTDDRDARYVLCLHIHDFLMKNGSLRFQGSWEALAANTVFVTAMSPLVSTQVRDAHEELTGIPSYLGWASVDLGCPIMRKLLWELLSARYVVGPGPTVQLVPTPGASEEDQWTRPEGDLINDYELSNRGWIEADDDELWSLGDVPPSPLSEFGRASQRLLREAMRPRRRELLAHALRGMETADRLPEAFDFRVGDELDDQLDVSEEKLTKYLLDPSHPKGSSKARWLRDTLDIGPDDWRYLLDQLQEQVPLSPPESVRITDYGVAYSVVMSVKGRNGRRASVRTAWIAPPEGPPRFVTAYPEDEA